MGNPLEGSGNVMGPAARPDKRPLVPVVDASENFAKQKEAVLAKETAVDCYPDMMLVVLTGRSNIECIMCPYRNSSLQDVPDHIVSQIPLFYPYLKVIEWEGGEAFVHKRFYELVRKASRYPQLRQVITTNALLFNREWYDLIVRSNMSLAISVDGATRATYEYVRAGADWSHLIRNLEALNATFDAHDRRPQHQLNVVLMRSNVRELTQFVEFAHRFRFVTVNFKMMKAFNHIPEVHDENLYAPENAELLDELIREIPRIDALCRERGMTTSWPGLTRPETIAEKEPVLAGKIEENRMFVEEHQSGEQVERPEEPTPGAPSGQDKLHCVLPWRRLYIHSGGVSVACGCIPEVHYTPDFDVLAFWNSATMRTFRNKIIRGETDWCGMNCLLGRENRMSQQEWEDHKGGVPVCGKII